MACTLPLTEPTSSASIGRAMSRCECAGVTFAEAAHRIRQERLTLPELSRRTGCGGNYSACIPDLQRYLADTE